MLECLCNFCLVTMMTSWNGPACTSKWLSNCWIRTPTCNNRCQNRWVSHPAKTVWNWMVSFKKNCKVTKQRGIQLNQNILNLFIFVWKMFLFNRYHSLGQSSQDSKDGFLWEFWVGPWWNVVRVHVFDDIGGITFQRFPQGRECYLYV